MQLEARIDQFIQENKQAIIEDMKAIIAVKSVEEGPAAPGAPFGAGPRKALDVALAIAKRMGFETAEDEGYLGWAEVPGEREEYIATITHLDVVPEGEGWNSDPYTLTEKEGWLIGRGIEDDKGPSILCLYAAAFMKELGVPKYTIRVLLGCNEETGMKDVDHYLERYPEPVFAFSPDTEFPVCHGEKGHFGGQLVSPVLDGNVVEIQGGIAGNVIPDRAFAVVKADAAKLQSTGQVAVSAQPDGLVKLCASGIGGHAAHPAGTINAIGQLVDYILANGIAAEGAERGYFELLQKLHSAPDGSGVGVDATDPVFDPLTIIGGQIWLEEGRIHQGMDSRFSPSTSGERMSEALGTLAEQHGAKLEAVEATVPFYIPADSAPVQALMETYNEVMGTEATAYTMGGGTYARHFKNAVSFGPNEPSEKAPDFVGQIHGANEGMSIDSLMRGLKIYILAMVKLQALEL